MKKLKQSVKLNTKKIIMAFEGTSYSTIKGNVDKMGLTMGYLQWNFGQRTLQPLLIEFLVKHMRKAREIMKNDADELMDALKSDNALEFACEKMNNSDNKIVEPWLTYLKNVCNTREFQYIQDIYTNRYFARAALMCDKYDLHTERAFCLFFDIALQDVRVKKNIEFSNLSYMDKLGKIIDYYDEPYKSSSFGKKSDFRLRKECILNGYGIVNGRNMTLNIGDSDAFEEDITEYINILRIVNVIENCEYWLENSVASKTVKGEYVAQLILKFLKYHIDYDENISIKDPISILKEMRLIDSTDYWHANAISGGVVDGEHAAELIKKLAHKINNKIKNSFLGKVW